MDKVTIIIRPALISDKNFVFATWLNGQRFGNFYFNEIPQDVYFREYAKVINHILSLPGMEVNIACDERDKNWIVGFAVFRGAELYWIHVKSDYRCKGIGRLLLENREIKIIKAFTRIGRAIAAKHGLIFNPFP